MPKQEKKTLEQEIREDTAMMAEFHHADFYTELKAHRAQCVENLYDSTLSDNDDPARGALYHSRDGDAWRARIAAIDIIGAEDIHSRFGK